MFTYELTWEDRITNKKGKLVSEYLALFVTFNKDKARKCYNVVDITKKPLNTLSQRKEEVEGITKRMLSVVSDLHIAVNFREER